MTIAIVLPRNMHFGPGAASSIDLCVRDAAQFSCHRERLVIICQECPAYFEDLRIRSYRPGPSRRRLGQIAEILREEKPELIVVHQHLPSAARLAREFAGTPVLLHKHNFIRAARHFRRWRRCRQLNRLAGVIFVSQACRDAFEKDFPAVRAARHVAHNGLVAQEWGTPPEKGREILAVGRVHPLKGMVEIAGALGQVLPEHPDWRATVIAGATEDAAERTRMVQAVQGVDRLDWIEGAPFAKVVEATRQARIAVVNTREEAFGRVAIEAFAGGAALITPLVGGLREVVGDAALALENGTADEIAGALRKLIADPALSTRLAAAGRARFERQFTMEQSASALDAIYDRTLAAQRS